MARIIIADDGIRFDGRTVEERPLGGVESAVVYLARALADRGHDIRVYNRCDRPLVHEGVRWTPIEDGVPDGADLFVANRGDKLIGLVPTARRRVFWIHNPARYLLKARYLSKLWRFKPTIVFIGTYHLSTYPRWAPGGERVVIPYGIPEPFLHAEASHDPPPPRAVFASNPLRSLDWLLDVWAGRIHARVPKAELHLFAGSATYGEVGAAKSAAMDVVLSRARSLSALGVVVRDPVPKPRLIAELRAARAMLYRGDLNETFCSAVGEAQAMGVPAVVQNLGAVAERVIDGETGFVAADETSFADAAGRILLDDALWRRLHEGALAKQRRWGWPEAAAAFESLIP
ncbi:MAG: glycosyltransferase family 4 protein [Rhodospirillales bacterium]|jgi:glycosyltransferase involved in cell wall biosynthesis|nr:glycosyltransferase family 4 protein [Rhodospirillales bacterium]MDP6805061.1 glycosyltransferase family 4 protein [Rhodospirillales bacterium]